MAEPLLLPNGELHQFTLKIGGKQFRCACGCNVFHKPDSTQPEVYQCNSCNKKFRGE